MRINLRLFGELKQYLPRVFDLRRGRPHQSAALHEASADREGAAVNRRSVAGGLLLLGLAGLAAGVWIDAARRVRALGESPAPSPGGPSASDRAADRNGLQPGTLAPEFSLPDASGRQRRLSEFRGPKTVLLFMCGCPRCDLMASAVKQIEYRMKGRKPQHLTVTTMKADSTAAWQSRTEYEGAMLFEPGEGPVMKRYHAAPCPRLYVLDRKQIIRYVSPPPDAVDEPAKVLVPLARVLGSPWTLDTPPPGLER